MTSYLNKNNNFSLQNLDNYKKNIQHESSEILKIYSKLTIDYLKYIIKTIVTKKKKNTIFIITRGLYTLTHVFLHILYYTKNLDITFVHCEKAFYFYVEFVSQISEDDKTFLQLSSRDATNYVYKKTIFEINNEIKRNIGEETIETKKKLDIINVYVSIYKKLIEKILESNIELNDYNNPIVIIEKITNMLHFSNLNIDDISTLEIIIDNIYYKINDILICLDIFVRLIKKILKEPDAIHKIKDSINQITDIDINEIKNNPNKFINLLFN